MKFATAYNRPQTIPADTGDGTAPVFEYQMEKGVKKLIKTGTTSVYDLIQSELEDTKVENIIKRATAGDENALERYAAMYFDSTQMPSTIAQAQEKIVQIQNEFYDLPVETRAMFSHNPDAYVHEYGTETWARKMGFMKEVSRETKEPVKEPTQGGSGNE